jgi:hypothetical protein
LRPEGAGPPEGFGTALALDGDTLVAGIALEDSGSVQVFTRGAEGFERSDVLLPIEAQYAAGFGVRVVLDGNTLAVGAMWGVGKPGQAVHVFERRDGRFEPKTVLSPDEPGGETFGLRMALRGNLLAVSDTGWDDPTREAGFGEGAVYLYERECEGDWVFRQRLTEPTELGSYGFGGAVAIDGDRIVVTNLNDGHAAAGIDGTVGEPSFDDNYTGTVHVFGRTESGYHHLNFLKDTVPVRRENYFGWALSADDGNVVVGARGEGAVYVLR